ncbi:hypothetical protein EVAR_44381_1 [Eumeta japonica]|uniref:Uncharacterized protein n=1 Tax=Eumeta variegata TaxID=151549 RepID=A0A4C1X5V5_EUMVA|nr:hypothetical protein EVAR_44381_1 [Eumeta japonica]
MRSGRARPARGGLVRQFVTGDGIAPGAEMGKLKVGHRTLQNARPVRRVTHNGRDLRPRAFTARALVPHRGRPQPRLLKQTPLEHTELELHGAVLE